MEKDIKMLPTTLLLAIKDNKILLANKKRGFGTNKYNGVGGKLEPGESVVDGMLRETYEEVGIVPTEYKLMGIIDFLEYYKGEHVIERTHIYICTKFDGEPQETDEMKPYWFDLNAIPYDNMFPDDRYWLPLVLKGKFIRGDFEFDEDFNKLSDNIYETTEEVLQQDIYKEKN